MSPKEQHADWCNYRHGRCDCGATDQKQAALTSKQKLKRFTAMPFEDQKGDQFEVNMEESGDGEWIRYEDIKPLRAALLRLQKLMPVIYDEAVPETCEALGIIEYALKGDEWPSDESASVETQPVVSTEWGGVEKLAQQRNDALAEVERLRNALSQSIGTVKRLMTESRQVETTGELERLRALQEKALALDDAVAEFGIDKPQYIAEVYQAFHDALHDGHGAMHAVEPTRRNPGPKCIYCGLFEWHAPDCRSLKASGTRLVEQRNGFKDGSTVPEQPAAPPSDKCEHGIPRQFCTAMHPEKTSAAADASKIVEGFEQFHASKATAPDGWCEVCGGRDGEHKQGCVDGDAPL